MACVKMLQRHFFIFVAQSNLNRCSAVYRNTKIHENTQTEKAYKNIRYCKKHKRFFNMVLPFLCELWHGISKHCPLLCCVVLCFYFCCGCVGLFLSQTHTMLQPDVYSDIFRFTVIFWESYIFFKFILYSQAPGETDIVDLHMWTNILLKFTARMWRGGKTKRRIEWKSEDRLYISHESFVLCWFKKEQFRYCQEDNFYKLNSLHELISVLYKVG